MKRPSLPELSPHLEKRSKKDVSQVDEEQIDTDGKILSELIRLKKKKSMKQAKFILSLDDMKTVEKSQKNLDETEWKMPQFFVQDLQRVLLFSIIGNKFRFFPRWCKIIRPQLIKSITFITINNLSEFDYKANRKKFKKMEKIFTNEVCILTVLLLLM